MSRETTASLLLIACLAFAPVVRADVSVTFEHPENYKDLQLSAGSTPKVQADLMNQFGKYFKQLGDLYLPKGDKLEIVVWNIDMAGGFEPWRNPNLIWTRILSDLYPPRYDLQYRWTDAAGRVKAEQRELVTDLNYRAMVGFTEFSPQDALRYDKATLKRWFRSRFAGESGQPLLGR